eukprot:2507779-Pleurochrysis_carterae.AAC.1
MPRWNTRPPLTIDRTRRRLTLARFSIQSPTLCSVILPPTQRLMRHSMEQLINHRLRPPTLG